MANKRQLKKQIRYICGDVAAECTLARHLLDGVDTDKLEEALFHIAELQQKTLARANVIYDKTPSEFTSKSEYSKAKEIFFNKAFTALREDFNKRLQEIVSEMNSALPKHKA